MYRKNTASQFVCFQLLLTASGAVATGLSPAVRRCIDGTFAAGGGTVTEDGTTGSYKYAMSQADTNGNDISFIFSAATAMPVCVNIVTTAADPTDSVRLGLTALPNAAASAIGGLPLAVDTSGRVDVLKINGTSQTARDIGASVLLSAGTGTGQLDFTSGVVKSNLAQILGTALTETSGQIAAGFKKFFNIATPASTMDALTLVATATNLTNAATSGDLTATMKTSVTTAASAATPAVTVSDKTGFSLSAAGVQAIWDALTSALTTVGSIGKLIVTNLDAAITSRMATYTQPTGFLAATFPTGTVANTTNITAGTITTVTTVTNQLTAAAIATGVWTDTTAGDFTTSLSVGKSLMNGVSLGTGLTVNDITTKTGYSLSSSQTFNMTGNITGNLSGSVGSVTGAVGSVTGAVGSVTGAVASVTGNVGGNVTGSVGSVVGAVGSVTGNVGGNVTGSIGSLATQAKTDAEDAIWDAVMSDHLTSLTTGAALNAAGAAGDPWTTALPGAYGAGTAGNIIGNNINATISSRLASASYTAPDNTTITAIAGYVDTEVAAIKAKTDQLTFTVSNQLDSNIQYVNDVQVNGDGAGTPWGP